MLTVTPGDIEAGAAASLSRSWQRAFLTISCRAWLLPAKPSIGARARIVLTNWCKTLALLQMTACPFAEDTVRYMGAWRQAPDVLVPGDVFLSA